MKKRLLQLAALFALGMACGAASAQTSATYTGVIKDLTQNIVTSGQVTFTLAPPADSTVPGLGRFTPTAVNCNINGDGTLSGYVAGIVSGACMVTMNSALSPSGTSYRICIQPYFQTPGSCFYDYAIQSTKDITTIVPTLATGPVNYSGIPGPALQFLGAWSGATSYQTGQAVSYNNLVYISLVNPNVNNVPSSSTSDWSVVVSPASVIASPSATQTITQPTGTTLGVNSLNGALSADQFAGSDIGAKINAAFAACGSAPNCKVTLPPQQNYSFSTRIIIPPILWAELDGQGSTLTWTGSGDAVDVYFVPSNAPTGRMKDIFFVNGGGNTASTNAVHVFARIAYEFRDVSFKNFSNAGSSGILLDTVMQGGTPYFIERTLMERVTTENTTKGIRLVGAAGHNSLAYTTIIAGECNLIDGQICLSIEGDGSFESADMYSAFIDLKGNCSFASTPGSVISVTNGGDIRTAMVNLVEETQGGGVAGYQFSIDANNSFVNATGNTFGGGLQTHLLGTSDTLVIPQLSGGFTLQYPLGVLGTSQSRNSKLIWNNNLRFGMVNDSVAEGYFQLFGRVTTDPSDPEVDATPSSGNMQYNLQYCDPLAAACGFGPGYGAGANTGGTTKPMFPLESTVVAVRNPSASNATSGDGGATMRRLVDATGNITDFVRSGIGGQPTNHYQLQFEDYQTFTDVNGIDCFSNSGTVGCKVSDLGLVPSATACSSFTAGLFNYIAGASGTKDTVQVCAKDASNTYAYRTIY